ncbi:hypothetical protein ACWERV_10675 [Streptomyces sp. NPDC004031]
MSATPNRPPLLSSVALSTAALGITATLLVGGCAGGPDGRYSTSALNYDKVVSYKFNVSDVQRSEDGETVTFSVDPDDMDDFAYCVRNHRCGVIVESTSGTALLDRAWARIKKDAPKLEKLAHEYPARP